MIQNEADGADWVHMLSSSTETDHTLLGRCRGMKSSVQNIAHEQFTLVLTAPPQYCWVHNIWVASRRKRKEEEFNIVVGFRYAQKNVKVFSHQ